MCHLTLPENDSKVHLEALGNFAHTSTIVILTTLYEEAIKWLIN